jgi:hypothetical protein
MAAERPVTTLLAAPFFLVLREADVILVRKARTLQNVTELIEVDRSSVLLS